MCDTFVALPNYTASGNLIFGKNSDREPNEEQLIVRYPATTCTEKEVQCTYISIPQVRNTNEVLLSKPFQMWGAEMGVNEYGVVIGNEAVFTKVTQKKTNTGLTGMDLLRLALERTPTAAQALDCIIDLLELHGQDACGGFQNKKFFYHNSFLIADKKEAWVLETAGKHWVAKKVEKYYSISNCLSIEEDFDRISIGTIDFVNKIGWNKKTEPFNFSKVFSDRFYTRLGNGQKRKVTIDGQLGAQAKKLSVGEAMSILSKHNVDGADFHPSQCTTASVCMHATGIINRSQTTGSMVAEIRKTQPSTIWFTGTSMPCLSIYKPFFLGGVTLLEEEGWPLVNDDLTFWWKVEKLHRTLCKDYATGIRLIQQEKKELQWDLLYKEWDLIQKKTDREKLNVFSKEALAQYLELVDRWEKEVAKMKFSQTSKNLLYRFFQNRNDKIVYLTRNR